MLPSEGDEARHFRPFVLAALQDATHELAALALIFWRQILHLEATSGGHGKHTRQMGLQVGNL